jgi:hypothetical protein
VPPAGEKRGAHGREPEPTVAAVTRNQRARRIPGKLGSNLADNGAGTPSFEADTVSGWQILAAIAYCPQHPHRRLCEDHKITNQNRGLPVAQKVTVQLVDDVDGSEAESTVEFALDGVDYTIDLSGDNAAKLRDALATYVASARRTGGRKRSAGKAGKTPAAPSTADRERNQAIREWAREQGMQVSDRGRIPSEIVEAYDKAN